VRRRRGQAITEFIIVVPVFIVLIFGAVQMALIYSAKNTLEYATFQAARLGAVNHAQYSAIRRGLIRGVAPLFTVSASDRDVSGAIKRGISGSRFSAQAEVDEYMRIIRVNPRLVHLDEFGVPDNEAELGQVLPNDNLQFRNPAASDGTNIQDANLLKLVVQYCMPLRVPLVNRLISSLSVLNDRSSVQYRPGETVDDPRFSDRNRFEVDHIAGQDAAMAHYHELCRGRGSDDREASRRGFMLTAEAVVRMQSPAATNDTGSAVGDRHCDGNHMACL